MHIKKLSLQTRQYPARDQYPFNLPIFSQDLDLILESPVTFLIGENGTGKSTLLEGISRRCRIHIWEGYDGARYQFNPYEKELYRFLSIDWTDGLVPGSFFSSQIFRNFARNLDQWASTDPGVLKYFGGESLLTKSHGQSLMAFFTSRFTRKGLYLLDEPETALSPKRQLELVKLLGDMSAAGHAQFIIATHSPILMACPGAVLYSFNGSKVKEIAYEQTDHYLIYKDFLNNRKKYLDQNG